MTRLASRVELIAATVRLDARLHHALKTVDMLADVMLHH